MSQPNADSPPAPDAMPRILVVDDDAAALRLLCVGLGAAGFDAHGVGSGEDALAQVAGGQFDAVVLDFEMPGINGAEVCMQIRRGDAPVREMPVIMLTAHSSEADEIRCLEAGANDFVTKPVSRAVLVARIQTQLRLRNYVRQLEEWRAVREADLVSAQATQRAFVPSTPPALSGWEVQARYAPLIHVGGDIYGWRRLPDGRWLFWMSDATGHGAAAALITALIAHLFNAAAAESASPSEILMAVDREFVRAVGGSVFMTACCAVLAEDGTMIFSSAGHPPLLIARRGGEVESHWPEKTILGLGERISLRETKVELWAGDVALLYTDGLFSRRSADGSHATLEVVQQAAAQGALGDDMVGDLITRVETRASGSPPDDDLAVIALRRTA